MFARTTILAALCAAPLVAQQPQQPDFRWEKALAAGSRVRLHNLTGDVTVTASSVERVEVTGIKRGDRRYFEDITLDVVETSDGIVVCPRIRGMDIECDESGFRTNNDRRRRGRDWDDRDWDDVSIDIVVRMPKSMTVSANSVSGDVSVTGAEGTVRAGSVSGDVEMLALRATGVRASSVSGDIRVVLDALTGEGDLHFSTVSGDVVAELPKAFDADVTMRSVSGQMDSEFPITLSGRMSRGNLEARIGKGGRELRVSTVSGDVRLRARP